MIFFFEKSDGVEHYLFPNRFNGVYGAAVAAKGIGDNQKAGMYFENLLKK